MIKLLSSSSSCKTHNLIGINSVPLAGSLFTRDNVASRKMRTVHFTDRKIKTQVGTFDISCIDTTVMLKVIIKLHKSQLFMKKQSNSPSLFKTCQVL